MAMLRNLRNMIKSGMDEKHHKMVLKKLTDEVREIKFCFLEILKKFTTVQGKKVLPFKKKTKQYPFLLLSKNF